MMKKTLVLIYLMGGFCYSCLAQSVDSARYKLAWKNVAIPSVIIMIGLTQVGHESQEFQTEVREDFPFFKSNLDDVAQYVPLGVSLFSGNLDFRLKHNFKTRFIYSAIGYATMGITVNASLSPLKVATIWYSLRSARMFFDTAHLSIQLAISKSLRL